MVGSGIAGLIAALRASAQHEVTIVTKGELLESNTRYAQGGIAAVMCADDSIENHVADTLSAGAGLNSREIVEILCSEGPDRILDLIHIGVTFDRHGGELARGREAAHSRARVLHAGGDSTGTAISVALCAAVRASTARILEHTFVSDLILRDGRAVGVAILNSEGAVNQLEADIVILASGGAGQLYRHTTNPLVATGDGIAAAARAGAVLTDLEFYQFHPTALALPGSFLISEAVRGEGATLLSQTGHRFMPEVHPDAELAPRDIVARAMAVQMAAQGGRPVLLDATFLGTKFLASRFPSIDHECRRHGLDWSRVPIPVSPAAHYWMGGIRTDSVGRTSVPGLLAVGEAACTGAHGANRLASNSLLEALVFAWRAVEKLAEPWPPQVLESAATLPARIAATGSALDRATLQRLMWDSAGVFRDAVGLGRAAAELDSFSVHYGGLSGRELLRAHEDANLLDLARLTVAAALARQESRGAHQRSDFSQTRQDIVRHLNWTLGEPVTLSPVSSVNPDFAAPELPGHLTERKAAA